MNRSTGGGNWDTTYEWKAVTPLGIGFGLVGLDRWIATVGESAADASD